MRANTVRSSIPNIVAVNEAVIASADIAREVQNHEGVSPVVAWAGSNPGAGGARTAIAACPRA